jgi:hypothetical protein
MPIAFDPARWDKIRADYTAWWAGRLRRPLISLTTWGRDPGRPEPALPRRHFTAHHDWSVTPGEIVDRWDHDLSCLHYLGDAFPHVWPNFGPGIAAAFAGCEVETDRNTVWFRPVSQPPVSELRLRFDPENRWLRRVGDIMAAAARRWRGAVQVGMTDLGGNLDIVASCRTTGKLLLDLCDHPDEVRRLLREAHDLWWRSFEHLDRLHRAVNPGYTAWTPIFSAGPYYMLQCDFAYMIGPEMFDAFVKPELEASCRRLENAFYHLDGVGQLPHLDSLLSIPGLRGIQWVPGDGRPDITRWPEVYRRIRRAGKLIQIFNGPPGIGWRALDIIAGQLGSAEGIILIGDCAPGELAEAQAFLKRHGAG